LDYAFRKAGERLEKLSLLPSDSVRRQIRATRNPIKQFEASIQGLSEAQSQRFYFHSFADLMGRALS